MEPNDADPLTQINLYIQSLKARREWLSDWYLTATGDAVEVWRNEPCGVSYFNLVLMYAGADRLGIPRTPEDTIPTTDVTYGAELARVDRMLAAAQRHRQTIIDRTPGLIRLNHSDATQVHARASEVIHDLLLWAEALRASPAGEPISPGIICDRELLHDGVRELAAVAECSGPELSALHEFLLSSPSNEAARQEPTRLIPLRDAIRCIISAAHLEITRLKAVEPTSPTDLAKQLRAMAWRQGLDEWNEEHALQILGSRLLSAIGSGALAAPAFASLCARVTAAAWKPGESVEPIGLIFETWAREHGEVAAEGSYSERARQIARVVEGISIKGAADCRISLDGTSLVWHGREYRFTKNQGLCIKALYTAWANGTPTLSEKTIAEEIGIDGDRFRMHDTFKDHDRWRELLESPIKGIFCLKIPDSQQAPT